MAKQRNIPPTEAARTLITGWMRDIGEFHALEVYPCAVERERDGTEYVERCEPEGAHFWTVYGRYRDGCVKALEDFLTGAEAIAFRDHLIAAHPHLAG